MSKATIKKQILATAKNEAGMLAELASIVSAAGVNLTGICAWSEGGQAKFALLTDNNAKTISAFSAKGIQAIEQEAVTIMLEDKIGSLAQIAQKIKKSGISLDYCYGTTCGCEGSSSLLVLVSKENTKIVSCLNN
jgi:hypothetical protein